MKAFFLGEGHEAPLFLEGEAQHSEKNRGDDERAPEHGARIHRAH
jgi:hypothetical protein